MILTPPDVISQFLIAIPIWLLFEAGIVFSSFFRVRENTQPKKPKKPANHWSSKSHNEMMDNIEKEMNDSVIENEKKKK